ncbi:serine hydrolase domain-containing protein [Paenibacillus gansuensis]|uniref:Serine hydrolase domain-containing protein n=1 Tax=Paenibacillus gansuensis TaxID=306542 RepID=A0ABW5PEP3_9BACL
MENMWDRAEPEEAGICPELLAEAEDYIAAQHKQLYSFLLVRGGKLAHERYYQGRTADDLMELRSATKSFVTTLIGIALEDGLLDSLDREVYGFFPEELPPSPSPLAEETTVRHLLTMTSGLYWQTGKRLGERWIHRMHRSPDWVRFILRLPVEPGLRGAFLYRSPDSHLLSAMLTRISGRPALDYAQEKLFAPLGIAGAQWSADPQGHTAGHIGLRLRAQDMARFGQMILREGEWQGRRLVPAGWIREASRPHSEGLPAYGRYGYQWWCGPVGGQESFCALGHGGQLISIFPELDLVAVFTGNPNAGHYRHPRGILERFVLPGLR